MFPRFLIGVSEYEPNRISLSGSLLCFVLGHLFFFLDSTASPSAPPQPTHTSFPFSSFYKARHLFAKKVSVSLPGRRAQTRTLNDAGELEARRGGKAMEDGAGLRTDGGAPCWQSNFSLTRLLPRTSSLSPQQSCPLRATPTTRSTIFDISALPLTRFSPNFGRT